MKKTNSKTQVTSAIAACQEKKAERLSILELDKSAGGFTDYFVICSGSNPRQIQAISDEVEQRLGREGLRPTHVEGYKQAEWVLLDYVDFVVHIFSEKAREFYDLERLWKSAKRLEPSELQAKALGRTRKTREGSRKAARSRPATSAKTPRTHRRPRKS
ncbi:MAG: ribosome silencing factor [Terriglobales bacterium]